MQANENLMAMKAALRVLTATTEKREPHPADIALLRRYAMAQADLPADELACDVIQRAMKRRSAEVHATRSSAL